MLQMARRPFSRLNNIPYISIFIYTHTYITFIIYYIHISLTFVITFTHIYIYYIHMYIIYISLTSSVPILLLIDILVVSISWPL